MLTVLAVGPQVLVQDGGRVGYAHLGVPRAGWLDAPAATLANRLVGNPEGSAVLEVLLGGLAVRTDVARWIAVTGAPTPATVDGRPVALGEPVRLDAGETLALATPATAMRSYVAIGGGVDIPAVLGSRSTDTLAGVGPARVAAGDRVPVGVPAGVPAFLDAPRPPRAGPLRLLPGPHSDWFGHDGIERLAGTAWQVSSTSDRIGLRLDGEPLHRDGSELPSEGMVLGAIQVPPDGQPVILLADHGPTGGYPVIAVVHPDDLWQCAQVRPGETLRFVPASSG